MGCKQMDVYRAKVLNQLLGCSTVAVDVYGSAFPEPKRENPEHIHEAFEHMNALLCDPVHLREFLSHYLYEAAARLKASPNRVGVLGFCFGGGCVMEMVRAGLPLVAAVSFHGVVDAKPLTNLQGKPPPPMQSQPSPGRPANGVHILVCTGRADPLVPPSMVHELQLEMDRAPAIGSLQIQVYAPNVVHAFTTPNRGESNGIVGFSSTASRFAWTSAFDTFALAFGLRGPTPQVPPEFFQPQQTSFL
ncbi:hypothetical protein BASA81_015423 [Batrachochytrium salamandrivorans]|nr:hypothetical protein BASA81_015423 [Batrachochytrium salamandrivorans]